MQAFYKGFLSKTWFDIQQNYYSTTIRDNKYNIMRWKKTIVALIIDRGNELWDERCTLMHLMKQGTEDEWYCDYLYVFLLSQRDKNDLNIRDRYLLKRTEKYFQTAHLAILEMWHSRFLAALQREKERSKNEGDDISKFVSKTRRRRKWRIIQPLPQPETYHQTTLWKSYPAINLLHILILSYFVAQYCEEFISIIFWRDILHAPLFLFFKSVVHI